MKNVLLVGSNGYIGSALSIQLRTAGYQVTLVDIGWYNGADRTDYHTLTSEFIRPFNVVILLAGHSSVNSCIGDINSPWVNNVTNFKQLTELMDSGQTLVYASSASVYGNSRPGTMHKESDDNFLPISNYDITKYALDMQAQLAIAQGKKIIGLRFGTVNGCSPVLRTDVMINSMYDSAICNKEIVITNKHISRAILGINDLCCAILTCIRYPVVGIYNLSSFNNTVKEIADAVSRTLDVPIREGKANGPAYDFALDCSLFSRTFDFTFTDTPVTIVNTLNIGYDSAIKQRRDNYIPYKRK